MTPEEADVLDCVLGRGRYQYQGGGWITTPHTKMHRLCVRLARQGFIRGENIGLWWYWTPPEETIQ